MSFGNSVSERDMITATINLFCQCSLQLHRFLQRGLHDGKLVAQLRNAQVAMEQH